VVIGKKKRDNRDGGREKGEKKKVSNANSHSGKGTTTEFSGKKKKNPAADLRGKGGRLWGGQLILIKKEGKKTFPFCRKRTAPAPGKGKRGRKKRKKRPQHTLKTLEM